MSVPHHSSTHSPTHNAFPSHVRTPSSSAVGANVSAAFKAGHGLPSGARIKAKYMPFDGIDGKPLKSFSQFEGAEFLARDYKLSRADLDQFGADSHARAIAATDAGYFKREIVPVDGKTKAATVVSLCCSP